MDVVILFSIKCFLILSTFYIYLLQLSKDNNQDFRMEWKRLDQIALDMPTLFDVIEEATLKVEDSEIEEVITVVEHKEFAVQRNNTVL